MHENRWNKSSDTISHATRHILHTKLNIAKMTKIRQELERMTLVPEKIRMAFCSMGRREISEDGAFKLL